MNKYQNKIDKLTKHYINNEIQMLNNFCKKHGIGGRCCGKIYPQIKSMIVYWNLKKKSLYRNVRKKIRKIGTNEEIIKKEYDCIWR